MMVVSIPGVRRVTHAGPQTKCNRDPGVLARRTWAPVHLAEDINSCGSEQQIGMFATWRMIIERRVPRLGSRVNADATLGSSRIYI